MSLQEASIETLGLNILGRWDMIFYFYATWKRCHRAQCVSSNWCWFSSNAHRYVKWRVKFFFLFPLEFCQLTVRRVLQHYSHFWIYSSVLLSNGHKPLRIVATNQTVAFICVPIRTSLCHNQFEKSRFIRTNIFVFDRFSKSSQHLCYTFQSWQTHWNRACGMIIIYFVDKHQWKSAYSFTHRANIADLTRLDNTNVMKWIRFFGIFHLFMYRKSRKSLKMKNCALIQWLCYSPCFPLLCRRMLHIQT